MGAGTGTAFMSPRPIAVHYALALYQVAQDAGKVPEVEHDMKVLARVFAEVPAIAAWCREPHSHEADLPFIRIAFLPYVGSLTARALLLVAENRRLEVIAELPFAFETVIAEGKKVRIKLEAAREPEADLLQQVKDALEIRTGRLVVVEVTIAPELLAGFRVFWNDRMVDLSARGRWQALRSRLKAGGER